MHVSNRIVKAALMDAWAYTKALNPSGGTALRDVLVQNVLDSRQLIAGGQIKTTSNDGHMTSFATGSGLGASDIVEVWVYLVEEFDRAKSDLGGDPDDTTVEARMESQLRPMFGYTGNYMYLSK